MDLIGRRVRFAVRDIYYPAPGTLQPHVAGHDQLAGEIVDVTDSGARARAFVVVRADGVETPLVVAVDRVCLEDDADDPRG
jgi:hypothetical protein